jgi:hypothetical protein
MHFGDCFLILGIGSAPLHPDSHDRPRQSATDGAFPTNPSAKTGRQLRENRILVPKILLETQGDRFSSVESLLKIAPRLFGHHLSVFCLLHVVSPAWPYGLLTDMLEEVNLRRRTFSVLHRAFSGASSRPARDLDKNDAIILLELLQ